MLASFQASRPDVSIVQFRGSDPEVREWLDTGAVDVAILGAPGAAAAEPLLQDGLKAVLPKGHQLARNNAIAMEELARVPFIMSAGGCEPMISALAESSGARLRVHYNVRDIPSIMRMVADGLGVTIVPALAASEGTRERPCRGAAPSSPSPARDRHHRRRQDLGRRTHLRSPCAAMGTRERRHPGCLSPLVRSVRSRAGSGRERDRARCRAPRAPSSPRARTRILRPRRWPV
jgi:DNA-binding transcriptional LysR family regulator